MTRQLDVEGVVRAIRSVVGHERSVALHEPRFEGNEWRYVKDCLDSTWVSYVGPYVDRFEAMLADFTGTKRAVALVNGTSALHAALQLVGVQADDEVLIPALTFVATANAVTYCGALPHFVDSEERTLGLDAEKLKDYLKASATVDGMGCRNRRTGRRIKAVVPMHTFGHPVDLDALSAVCTEYQLEMIEDAAESLGSFYRGAHTGNWGRLAILSFNGNKTITTGGGGAIITNDEALGKQAKHLTSTAKEPHRWEYRHDRIGYNYRLPNVNAAIGCAQMEQLPHFLAQKRKLAERYRQAFATVGGVSFFNEPAGCRSNYWLNTLLLDTDLTGYRDAVLQKTNDGGLMTRPAWTLLNTLSMYRECPAMDLECAEALARRLINLPSSPFLEKANAAS